jgi:hypothetical protein
MMCVEKRRKVARSSDSRIYERWFDEVSLRIRTLERRKPIERISLMMWFWFVCR